MNTFRPTITTVRSFWDERPCNIRHSPKPIASREYFEEVESRKYFVEPHIPKFADFKKWQSKRILEVGCGIGTDAINFARAGAEYTGIELSKVSLELTRKRFELYNLPGRLMEADAENVSAVFPGEKFDLIYSFGVIHHSPDPERIVDGVAKLMHKDSEFRLMLYSRYSWKNLMVYLGFDQPEAQTGCPIADVFSFEQVRSLLQKFDILEIKKDHVFKYKVADYRQYQYKVVPWFSWMPQSLFRSLERNFGWHTLIRCKLKAHD